MKQWGIMGCSVQNGLGENESLKLLSRGEKCHMDELREYGILNKRWSANLTNRVGRVKIHKHWSK